MSDDPAPAYEIDMGDSHPEPSAPAVRADAGQPSADEDAAERQLNEARAGAVADWEAGGLASRKVDIEGLILAGLCGEGVGALFRVDDWHAGVHLAMLATLASLGAAAWMWWRTRQPAMVLGSLPMPFDPSVVVRHVPMDAAQRAASRQRRTAEFERIRTSTGDLAACRRRLRSAIHAALGGAFCGWLAGAAGSPGVAVLAASAAAGTAAVTAWLAAGGTWPVQRLERIALGVVPGVALLAGLVSGASPWSAIGGPLAAAAAGWFWRRRLIPLVAASADPS